MFKAGFTAQHELGEDHHQGGKNWYQVSSCLAVLEAA